MKRDKTNTIEKIQISITTSQEVLDWSSGEVTKPETINYKTYKPEKDGLFDEIIFGPIKDFKCPVCGKKHKRSDVGKPCQYCGKSIIESKLVRRRKMGHIELAAPVSHIWFSKVNYSTVKSIIGLKQDDLDSLIYFKVHVVVNPDKYTKILKVGDIITVQNSPSIYSKILKEILRIEKDLEVREIITRKLQKLHDETKSEIGRNYGIDFYEYNNFINRYSGIKIGTGAEALKEILENIDLDKEIKFVKNELKTKTPTNSALLRRLKIIESFITSKQTPKTMIFTHLPVIPADLRPLIQLDGGRHSTIDINELYRRVIIRNNRLKKWIQIGAPDLITQNEKRMLQESVDALFDNSRKKIPINSKDNRPLKSFAENLKGKQGRFRQNLLGKRVDYSGRSVIVVGPELKLHQVGLPKQMAVKLFEPFIVNLLVEEEVASSIKQAKKMIEMYDDRIWRFASQVIKNHPVLLNRAPTLHRLSVQAFEPVITSGKAIRLHPLVTPSFNADFDGDQMAVHVPLTKAAKQEAFNLMLSSKNILGPKDGNLILSPSQDIILGLYYLTKGSIDAKNSKIIFDSVEMIQKLLLEKELSVHSIIAIRLTMFKKKFIKEIKKGYKYLITTVGRVILNNKTPEEFVYINNVSDEVFLTSEIETKYLVNTAIELKDKFSELATDFKPFKKARISRLIEAVFAKYNEHIAEFLDEIKALGFKYSMLSGVSMSVADIIELPKRKEILKYGDEQVKVFAEQTAEGLMTDDERYQEVLKVWANVKDEIKDNLQTELEKNPSNALYMMMDSGARGNISNFVQLAGMRGSMSKATHEYAALKRQGILVRSIEEIPIKSSFKVGLSQFEYFLSTHGARKGLSDTATKTAESGYLTRRLVDAVQDVTIVEEDCKVDFGIKVKDILDTRTNSIIENLKDRIVGRVSVHTIKHGNKVIAKAGDYITVSKANQILKAGIKEIEIRTPLTCNSKRGICKKCFGIDLTTSSEVNIGEAVGIISAQSIGEPGTQLTMRTFHTGGVAGVADITQGFTRLMELVDANKNPKFSAIIAKTDGVVKSLEPLNFSKSKTVLDYLLVIENQNEEVEYVIPSNQLLRVKNGETITAGQKLTEGAVKLQDLLEYAGPTATQAYLIKEIQRLYRVQGINISDKYIEVIVKQMLSKYKVIDSGDSTLYVSQVISSDYLKELNYDLLKVGKNPVYAKQIILGVKVLPLYSESFLSAASYQRTAEALVNASIEKKIDNLYGIKENLIVGNRIPVGTGLKHPYGKYNFKNNKVSEKYENDYYLNNESIEPDINPKGFEEDEIIVVNELDKKSNF